MAKKSTPKQEQQQRVQQRKRRLWAVVGALLVFLILLELIRPSSVLTRLWDARLSENQRITNEDAPLASFFAPEVLRWSDKLHEWAKLHHVNPNVIAIVIQIESCGKPDAISYAGALGLMQVMPFHFDYGENMLDPDVNVRNGMDVFYECLKQYADWNLGIALACYNGGPGVTFEDRSTWPDETQAYYQWATGLWSDVTDGNKNSDTLSQWLDAGGQRLCQSASEVTN
jgi:soluble lytic murein transglycosylase-like protein